MNFQKEIIFILLLSFLLFSCDNQSKIKNTKSVSQSKFHQEENYKKLKASMKALNYKDSRILIQSLILKYNKEPELYYLIAVITKNTNPDPLEAIKFLQAAVALDDKYGDAWKLLGDLYYIRKEFKNALKAWEISIETIKDNANLYYRLAYIYYTQNDYKLAIKYFNQSLKVDNKLEWSYYYLADIYFKNLSNTKKGIEEIKKGLVVLPKSKNLNQKLAIFYYDTENYEDAIKFNKEVLKITNNDSFAIENISDAYMKLKDYDKAIEWLNKILKEQPKSIYYVKKMSDIYQIKNEFKKAIELLEFSYNLKKDSDVKSKIAKLYLIIGDKDKYNELVKELKDSKNPSDIRASQYLMMENSKDADSSRLKENSKDADSKPLKKENTKEKK